MVFHGCVQVLNAPESLLRLRRDAPDFMDFNNATSAASRAASESTACEGHMDRRPPLRLTGTLNTFRRQTYVDPPFVHFALAFVFFFNLRDRCWVRPQAHHF